MPLHLVCIPNGTHSLLLKQLYGLLFLTSSMRHPKLIFFIKHVKNGLTAWCLSVRNRVLVYRWPFSGSLIRIVVMVFAALSTCPTPFWCPLSLWSAPVPCTPYMRWYRCRHDRPGCSWIRRSHRLGWETAGHRWWEHCLVVHQTFCFFDFMSFPAFKMSSCWLPQVRIQLSALSHNAFTSSWDNEVPKAFISL